MAEQITHDVVNEAQSMGGTSPIDVNATSTNQTTAGDGQTATDTTANPIPSEAPANSSPKALEETAPEASNSGALAAEAGTKEEANDTYQDNKNEAMADKANAPLVNDPAAEHATAEDNPGQQAVADASGGSDTDTSRAESLGQSKDGKARSSSVKKPTSFKSVSVTKHFLAKTAVAAPTKVGEKVASGQSTPTIQPTAKPRLVAKSGTGVGSSVPRTNLSNLNGTAPGPDGSKVWNKNRPVPVPPPKQFTDEELKQQFGIHMATRLQADDESKESKWADIDDDEDDWAPETVEWMDGTKSTVKTTENVPPPEEPKPKPSEPEQPSEPPKPPVPAATAPVSRPNSTSGTKTILKPGSLASTGSPKPAGLVLKGQPDKPTLVAKPSAPSAVKSPWAPLPPIEKVSPVVINPPVQQQAPSRFSQRDPHGFDALGPAPSPAKEIAADDFNRSWREERGPRELFNSQSGRYEPVREMRRGSVREQNFRQPSVLQRPSHHEQGGPAEPSASFQTSRSGAGHEYGGRRRTSSNVSGDAGRRGSFSRPQEYAVTMDDRRRRGSHALTDMPPPPMRSAQSQQRGGIPERGPSPAGPSPVGPAASLTQHPSPAVGQAQLASPLPPSASPAPPEPVVPAAQVTTNPTPEQIARQNELMRERLERARQRKKEEAENEEAAKRERIRQRLERLPPVPSKASDKAKSPAPAAAEGDANRKPAPVQSPPKPPVPTADGEVAQYGMMKVHQAHPVKKHIGEQVQSRRHGDHGQSHADAKRHDAPSSSLGAAQQDVVLPTTAPLERESSWKPTQSPESHTVWGGRMRSHGVGGNVWAPASQERHVVGHIGNGTFAGHTQPSHVKGQGRPPGPIAPPPAFRVSPSKSDLPQPSLPHSNNFEHQNFDRPTFESQQSFDHSKPFDHRQAFSNHHTRPEQTESMTNPPYPAHRGGRRPAPPLRLPRDFTVDNRWQNITSKIQAQDREMAQQAVELAEKQRIERGEPPRPPYDPEKSDERLRLAFEQNYMDRHGIWHKKPSTETSSAPSASATAKLDVPDVQKPATASLQQPDMAQKKSPSPPPMQAENTNKHIKAKPEEKTQPKVTHDTSIPPNMRKAMRPQQQNAPVSPSTNAPPHPKPTVGQDKKMSKPEDKKPYVPYDFDAQFRRDTEAKLAELQRTRGPPPAVNFTVTYSKPWVPPPEKPRVEVTHDTSIPPHKRKAMRLQQEKEEAERQSMASGQDKPVSLNTPVSSNKTVAPNTTVASSTAVAPNTTVASNTVAQNMAAAPIPGPHKAVGSVGATLPPIGAEKSAAAQQAANQTASGNGRASRFFPRSNEGSPQVTHQVQLPPTPPPESESHPAFSGDARFPVVKLPMTPTVRLPPVSSAPAVTMPPRAGATPSLQIGSKPIVAQSTWAESIAEARAEFEAPYEEDEGFAERLQIVRARWVSGYYCDESAWQGRIDSLLHRDQQSSSTPAFAQRSPSPAERSATKAPLDQTMHRKTATVSLPSKDGVSKVTYSQVAAGGLASAVPAKLLVENLAPSVMSKPIVEDEVMDQPVAFSKPTVHITKDLHRVSWLQDPPAPTQRPRMPMDVEGPTTEEMASIMAVKTHESDNNIYVRVLGMLETKTVVMRIKDVGHNQSQTRKPSGKFKGKKKNNFPRSEQDNGANGVSGNEPAGNAGYSGSGTGGYKSTHPNPRFGQNNQRYNSGERPHGRGFNSGAHGNDAQGYGANAVNPSNTASGDARLHQVPNASGQGFPQGNMSRANSSGNWGRNADMSGGSGTAAQHNGPRSASHGNWYKKSNKPNRGGGQGSPWDNNRRTSGPVQQGAPS